MLERQVEFEVKGQKLVGTLCIPEGKGPFPATLFLPIDAIRKFRGSLLLVQSLTNPALRREFNNVVCEWFKKTLLRNLT